MSCQHFTSFQFAPPKSSSKVYKDECTQCFDDATKGIYVCLACFNGGCLEHAKQHADIERAAEKAAARVKGVKAVVEELKVQLHASMIRSDENIAKAAVDRLFWEVRVPRDAIKVKVEDGFVTLSGSVEWHYQLQAAEQAVRGMYGVLGVVNQAIIKPRPDAINIGNSIDRALHRAWFDPKTINVTAHDGRVKLTGSVKTPSDRNIASATAWGAPGATSVENDLVVIQ